MGVTGGTNYNTPSVDATTTTTTTTTTNNTTATTQAPSGVNPAIIGTVIGLLVIAFLVVLIVVLFVIFLLLWKKRRDRKEAGYQPAKKDSRSAGRQISQSNEMGLYEPITKEQISDPLYEEPDHTVKSRTEKGYSTLIEEQPGDSLANPKNNGVSAENQWYEGGDNYNIYARPEVSIAIIAYPIMTIYGHVCVCRM